MKIFIGTDHAGFGLKEKLLTFLKAQGHEVVDKGAYEYNEGDDYPDFVIPVAREVSQNPDNVRGIILGATGEGEAIAQTHLEQSVIAFQGRRASIVAFYLLRLSNIEQSP